MASKYLTLKLAELLKRGSTKPKYVLPNFQRDFVWERDSQRALLASFIARLPIGSVLILEGNNKIFSARTFGSVNRVEPLPQCFYVLDGQQRLSTLNNAVADPFASDREWEGCWTSLFPKLRVRWFIDLKESLTANSDAVNDVFGVRDLKFDPQKIERLEQQEVEEILGSSNIYKKDKTKCYHPGFRVDLLERKKIQERNDLIAKELGSEYRIPIWELNLGSDGLHRFVLDYISAERAKKLGAEAVDGERSRRKVTKKEIEEIQNRWVRQAAKWASDVGNWLDQLYTQSEMPSIVLDDSDLPRAVGIFEAINRGGTPLSVFDLVVARSAHEIGQKSLSQVILGHLNVKIPLKSLGKDEVIQQLRTLSGNKGWGWTSVEMFVSAKDGYLTTRTQNQFLNLLSLLKQTNRIGQGKVNISELEVDSIKKEAILQLSAKEISNGTEKAIIALSRAMAFLQLRCGVRSFEDLHYQLMILPIAFVLADDKQWKTPKIIDKLEYWFWVSLFAGRFREKQNEICIIDIKNLWAWCQSKAGAKNPFENAAKDRLFNVQDYCDEKCFIPTKGEKLDVRSPAKMAILSFILSREPYDFDSNTERLSAWKWAADAYSQKNCEMHHILPLKNAANLMDSSREIRKDGGHILNSPLNLTYIGVQSNRNISALPPSEYMKRIGGWQQASHFVPTSYDQKHGEDSDTYWRRILKERFDALVAGVRTRLQSLVS